MLAVPAVEAVNVDVHVPIPAVVPTARMHKVNVPVTPLSANVTGPVGVRTIPAEESVTVAVHVEPWLTTKGPAQETVVVVALVLTVTGVAVLLLPS